MDELMLESIVFDKTYATGTRTTRGLEAITLSIPPTPRRSVVKRPDNSKIFTLGKVFKDKGYDIAYLYGGRGYFDNTNAFFQAMVTELLTKPILVTTKLNSVMHGGK